MIFIIFMQIVAVVLFNLLQEIVLKVCEIVLPDDLLTRKRTEQLAEDHQHGGRARPTRHHTVGHLTQYNQNHTDQYQIHWVCVSMRQLPLPWRDKRLQRSGL